ncbi:hypothetical protein A2Z10_00465 [Candidatus Azambacteria bacterium RBG_16_47_10]|uniref:Uncharacterized protein n=1 Tax=Candidatus Azambacteria bacterium RBG_16_47_10 TaxID=1797292 RepID=A0A1F5AYG0_9BACT|nr:MAG: hypothetical protein A2Z10_00465 [Candidatus Azambacteria bacterium RBG_16_47_10]
MTMKWRKWDFLAVFLMMLGVVLLLAASGTSDVKSIVPDDLSLAGEKTLFLLTILGCISALAGVFIFIRKGK